MFRDVGDNIYTYPLYFNANISWTYFCQKEMITSACVLLYADTNTHLRTLHHSTVSTSTSNTFVGRFPAIIDHRSCVLITVRLSKFYFWHTTKIEKLNLFVDSYIRAIKPPRSIDDGRPKFVLDFISRYTVLYAYRDLAYTNVGIGITPIVSVDIPVDGFNFSVQQSS